MPRRAAPHQGTDSVFKSCACFLPSFFPSFRVDRARLIGGGGGGMQCNRDDHRGVSSLAFRHRSPYPFGDGPRKGPQIYEMKVLLCRDIRHGGRRISWSAVAFPFRSRITPPRYCDLKQATRVQSGSAMPSKATGSIVRSLRTPLAADGCRKVRKEGIMEAISPSVCQCQSAAAFPRRWATLWQPLRGLHSPFIPQCPHRNNKLRWSQNFA